ncbi:hypothetical protein CUZ56_01132 [Saezia sanguinis]|uniref:Uncharacterized protein n=2 Tax=Saezia sanguinis TaxID=1965230 RepID=A0A433SEL7_9BURK|nr:hypothetical protein CUZ56_01132 [Saezia sanguinis]
MNAECLNHTLCQARRHVECAWQEPAQWTRHLQAARDLLQLLTEETGSFNTVSNTVVLTCLGAVYCDMGEFEAAYQYLSRAIEAGATDRNTYFNLAVACINQEARRSQAQALFAKAGQLSPDARTWEAYFDPHAH